MILQLVQLHQVLRIQLGDSQFEERILVVDRLERGLRLHELLQLRKACPGLLLVGLRLALDLWVGQRLDEGIPMHELSQVRRLVRLALLGARLAPEYIK